MLWEVEIRPAQGRVDRDAIRVISESRLVGAASVRQVRSARSFLIQSPADQSTIERAAIDLLVDSVVETFEVRPVTQSPIESANGEYLVNVLFRPGVTDNVAHTTLDALRMLGTEVQAVATCRKYWINRDTSPEDLSRLKQKVLANAAIEHVVQGPLQMESLSLGSRYKFSLVKVPLRGLSDEELVALSRRMQLSLNIDELHTVCTFFADQGRDPTDVELETIAQTWSEHCSHKTLRGRIRYSDGQSERSFENLLRETIFAATETIREKLGPNDWCVSVFRDNAGIVQFDDRQNVCMKVETHNHPSAIEPYGGANTGLGGVIRDPLGTGLGGRPVCNTDVFCFAPPDVQPDQLPPSMLHPMAVAKGVVAGVRDYGNRMGIPTVNGALFFDERYLGNPLVYCGNVAMIPNDKCQKQPNAGDLIVAVGGRTGRDGIHGATFSSVELTSESETISGGAVQIGDAVTEKMLMDVILQARDLGLYTSITDCGAGGFSSAVGEMGEHLGAEVWLDSAPLKYAGLSYTEIWISEAQERMVLAVPPDSWPEFEALCKTEGVEATAIGRFEGTGRLVLKYENHEVGNLPMSFLHDGRPTIVRDAVYQAPAPLPLISPKKARYDEDLKNILGSWNVCSKEWIIRQYDHEVQAGSVIKPLVGIQQDGPSDAAVVRPDLASQRGLVISCGMNPRFGDLDPYWMAASAIDEAVRNCVAVGADFKRIAILDNFCWGNPERPATLGTLVRAALGCHDAAIAYETPFISGKDSLYNEFSYTDDEGQRQTVAIPPSLLISAIGQIPDVSSAVSMDVKEPGNILYQVGTTRDELGGSHFALVNQLEGGTVPIVDLEKAPALFTAVVNSIRNGLIRSCHDLSEGGLAVALAEMAFAGGLGVDIDLQALAKASDIENNAILLFSESNTRFVIEVSPDHATTLETEFTGLPLTKLGTVQSEPTVTIRGVNNQPVVMSSCSDLKASWKAPLAWD